MLINVLSHYQKVKADRGLTLTEHLNCPDSLFLSTLPVFQADESNFILSSNFKGRNKY